MVSYLAGLEFAKPIPLHALTAGAEAAREAVRAHGRSRADKPLTGDVGMPPAYREPVPAAARKMLHLAAMCGFEAQLIQRRDGVCVEGLHAERRVGFRAYWKRGKADGGSWHAPLRYEMTEDRRAVRIDKTGRVALKGARAAGVGQHHLRIVATPIGVPCNVTEIEKRIKG